MKKLIFCLLFLFSTNGCLFAQVIFTDEASDQKFLFIGGVYKNEVKLINLNNHSILWMDKENLQQTDQLSPAAFLQKIFSSKLFFHATGSKPNWDALISQQVLQIDLPNGKKKRLNIHIDLESNPIDNAFVPMFHSKDRLTYGLIKTLDMDSPCVIDNDGINIFEIFINYHGQIIRGCASVDTKIPTAFYPPSIE